mmetsp:Transcript_5821/g.10597  ORF Transcript_5821/g.10597 Transcript_5821/m.10597 type:complete len:205 (+) Transcript_5821:73-687(+)
MTGPSLFSIAVLLTVSLLPLGTNAFSAAPLALCLTKQLPTNGVSRRKTALGIGNLFGGGEKKQETSSGGGTTVVDIQAKTIKVGGLRFFLNIYLVGQCNTPEQGSWLVQQNDEGKLDLYFKDGTGMLSVDISEVQFKADRYGEKPSLSYMLNESIMLHGLLDELNALAFDVEDIEEEKRLIQFNAPGDDAINLAREKLPARPAS